MAVSKKEIGECPIDAALSVIDGRWKGTILWRLADGRCGPPSSGAAFPT